MGFTALERNYTIMILPDIYAVNMKSSERQLGRISTAIVA
jgi:hypothetical protein